MLKITFLHAYFTLDHIFMLFPMKIQDFCYINKFKRLQKKKKRIELGSRKLCL